MSGAPRALTPDELLNLQGAPAPVAGLSDEQKAANRTREGQVLADLFAFADELDGDSFAFAFPRKSGTFRFSVHAISETESYLANKQATTYKTQKALGGLRIPEETDQARFRSYLIVTATVEADQKLIWKNPQVLQRLGVVNAADVVDLLLRAGEKQDVIDKINELSGFGATADAAKAEVIADLGD